MAIDPGPEAFAVFCPHVQAKVQVAPKAKVNEKAIRRIQRLMDRSLRAVNPNAFVATAEGPLQPLVIDF